jgi:elongator complex protein 1
LASPDSRVAGFGFSLELDALTIGLSSGELLVLHIESQQLEEVGAVDGGIVALEWSPDGELFVAASGLGSLLMMNQVWQHVRCMHAMHGRHA